jgi:tetratricopeptide (TPR) repeat protein
MSQNKKINKKSSIDIPKTSLTTKPESENNEKSIAFYLSNPYFPFLLIFILSCLLYGNTIQNKYAVDDGIVITENAFTQKGFEGIADIFTNDAFAGCLGKSGSSLVQGGRYRPLSIASFAVEQELWGQSPAASHFINVLLFALSGMCIFYFLKSIHNNPKKQNFLWTWPFWATILFIIHPIHTEVIANIKGRDEILCLLFSMLSLIFSLKYLNSSKIIHLICTIVFLFLGLLSKENAITFFAIIPLTFYFFTNATSKQYWLMILSLALPIVIFLFLRFQFTSTGMKLESTEIMNNPFVAAIGSERIATILLTWFYYIKLLFAPIVLTHDYYFNQIPYVNFSNPITLISLIIHLALLYYAVKKIKEKNVISYGIFYYFICFSVVSNLLFSVGILMNERFVFIPSLGFCIIIAYLIQNAIEKELIKRKTITPFLIIIGCLFSFKTISRNMDWKDNLSLFAADVQSSDNSAKAHSTYGGLLYEEVLKTDDTLSQNEMLALSYQHLSTALEIYPNYSDALQIFGNVLFRYKKDYQGAINSYQKAMSINSLPNAKLFTNLGLAQLRNNMFLEAKLSLLKSNSILENQYGTIYSLGETYDQLNVFDSAFYWYKKSIELRPNDGIGYYKIGAIYGKKLNNIIDCMVWMGKAIEKEPNNLVYLEDFAVAKGLNGEIDYSIKIAEKIIQINPNYSAAYRLLSASYLKKGDKEKSDYYLKRASEMH